MRGAVSRAAPVGLGVASVEAGQGVMDLPVYGEMGEEELAGGMQQEDVVDDAADMDASLPSTATASSEEVDEKTREMLRSLLLGDRRRLDTLVFIQKLVHR